MELLLTSLAMYCSMACILFSVRSHLSGWIENIMSMDYTQFALIGPGVFVGSLLVLKFLVYTIRSFKKIFFIDTQSIISSMNPTRRLKNYTFVLRWLLQQNNKLKKEILILKEELEESHSEIKKLVDTWTPQPSKKNHGLNSQVTVKVKPKTPVTPALMEYDFVDSYPQTEETDKSSTTDDGTWADYIHYG